MPVLKAYVNGQWVRVGGGAGGGGGTDEVWVGPDEPVDPNAELWIDSDDTEMTDPDVARWNSAWGVIDYAYGTAPFTVTTPQQFVAHPELTVTWQSVVGRRYRVTAMVGVQKLTATGTVFLSLLNPTIQITGAGNGPMTAGQYTEMSFERVFDGNGGLLTFVVGVYTENNGCVVFADTLYQPSLIVEDVGPVTMSSPPPPTPEDVWTAAVLQNGWTNLGGGWASLMYRRLGDMTQVRGVICNQTPTAVGTLSTFATLPVGYRPPHSLILSANCCGANYGDWQCRIDTLVDGTLSVWNGGAPQNIHIYTSINFEFSVSA